MSVFIRPRSLSELFSIYRTGMEFVAGGTDWIIKNRMKNPDSLCVADISAIEEMKGIYLGENYLRIGSLETMTKTAEHPLARRYAAALCDAAYAMGSEQIRNRATLGGNIANSSCAADTPAPLAVLGAFAVISSARGERETPVEQIIGCNKNNLARGEIIKEIRIPTDEERISAFAKIGSRSQVSISRVNLAISAVCEGGVFGKTKVCVGTLGLAARHCESAEGLPYTPDFVRRLPDTLCECAANAIPGRATLPYKQSALRALAMDVCSLMSERAKNVGSNERR